MQCPVCDAEAPRKPRADGLVVCPSCAVAFAPPGGEMLSMVARSGEGPRELSTLALPAAFRRAYRIERTLGAGGQGSVFLATVLATGRTVAVKFLARRDPDMLKRFQREGELMRALDHPHVARVLDAGAIEGHPFLVMEFLGGGSLRTRLEEGGAMPWALACTILAQVASGLAACHARGIVHRDVKPENVMFAEDGTAKLTDLGIARDLGSGAAITQTGAILGTVAYLSPEVINGQEATRASDVFAAGVMLHEAIAGQRPFVGDNMYVVMKAIETLPPRPLATLVPGVPDPLSALAVRCLSRDPAARPSADALARELRALSGAPLAPEPMPAALRAVLIAGLAGGLALLAAVTRTPPRPPAVESPASPAAPSSVPVASASVASAAAAPSPRSGRLAALIHRPSPASASPRPPPIPSPPAPAASRPTHAPSPAASATRPLPSQTTASAPPPATADTPPPRSTSSSGGGAGPSAGDSPPPSPPVDRRRLLDDPGRALLRARIAKYEQELQQIKKNNAALVASARELLEGSRDFAKRFPDDPNIQQTIQRDERGMRVVERMAATARCLELISVAMRAMSNCRWSEAATALTEARACLEGLNTQHPAVESNPAEALQNHLLLLNVIELTRRALELQRSDRPCELTHAVGDLVASITAPTGPTPDGLLASAQELVDEGQLDAAARLIADFDAYVAVASANPATRERLERIRKALDARRASPRPPASPSPR